MIASTFRRAARRSAISHASSNPSASPIAATQSLLASRCHQRRHSSSKPPTPPNDRSATISNAVKTVSPRQSKGDTSKSKADKRAGAESRLSKRKLTEEGALEERPLNLPTVPNTNHLHAQDVSVAAFFAFHRPISISKSIPPALTQEDFSSIFTSKQRANSKGQFQVLDVVYTVSSAIQGLEEAIHQQSPSGIQSQDSRNSIHRQEASELLDSVTQSSTGIAQPNQTHHLDGEPNNQGQEDQTISLSVEQLAQHFRPYRPPPPPVPMLNVPFDAEAEEVSHRQQSSEDDETALRRELQEQRRNDKGEEEAVYQSLVTMRERTSRNGVKFFTAHATPLVRVSRAKRTFSKTKHPRGQPIEILSGTTKTPFESSSPYLNRRNQNFRLPEGSDVTLMHALSVRRQRKLKMKKHKHKKLLRKTRNLRRKLDKL